MHPLLTQHLIEMMQDAAANSHRAQLIFTTHNTGLLDLTRCCAGIRSGLLRKMPQPCRPMSMR